MDTFQLSINVYCLCITIVLVWPFGKQNRTFRLIICNDSSCSSQLQHISVYWVVGNQDTSSRFAFLPSHCILFVLHMLHIHILPIRRQCWCIWNFKLEKWSESCSNSIAFGLFCFCTTCTYLFYISYFSITNLSW